VAALACIVVVAGVIITAGPEPQSRPLPNAPKPIPSPTASLGGSSLLGETRDCVQSLTDLAKEPLIREIRNTSDDVEAAGRALLSSLPIDLARNKEKKASPARRRPDRSG